MHIDRRKSGVDLLEHVLLGAGAGQVHQISQDRSPRSGTKRRKLTSAL
jgi:hypothetical protein